MGLLSVGIISLSGVTGAVLWPVLKSVYYPHVLTSLIGLAVGSLSSTALFQLIPEAFEIPKYDESMGYLATALCGWCSVWIIYFIECVSKIAFRKTPVEEPKKVASYECNGIEETFQLKEQSDYVNNTHDAVVDKYKPKKISAVAWMIIFGDGIHNFIDGVTIGAGYSQNIGTGVGLSIAIACEEFPHELGDFAILLQSGMSLKTAMCYNFLSACTAFLGLILGIVLGGLEGSHYIFAFAGSLFLYISLGHLIPELKGDIKKCLKESRSKATVFFFLQNIGILTGCCLIYSITRHNEAITNLNSGGTCIPGMFTILQGTSYEVASGIFRGCEKFYLLEITNKQKVTTYGTFPPDKPFFSSMELSSDKMIGGLVLLLLLALPSEQAPQLINNDIPTTNGESFDFQNDLDGLTGEVADEVSSAKVDGENGGQSDAFFELKAKCGYKSGSNKTTVGSIFWQAKYDDIATDIKLFAKKCKTIGRGVPNLDSEWENYKKEHGKSYSSPNEEKIRRELYFKRKDDIEEHNARYKQGLTSYSMKLNHFSDMHDEEMAQSLGSLTEGFLNHPSVTSYVPSNLSLPPYVDWRRRGMVTSVKNQGSCGSCWAFSTVGGIEAQWKKRKGELRSLSPQQLVDCSLTRPNTGCKGGNVEAALTDIIHSGGIMTERDYPYHSQGGHVIRYPCRFDRRRVAARVRGWSNVPSRDERAMAEFVANRGPVSAMIHVSRNFYHYKRVYFQTERPELLDHQKLVGHWLGTERLWTHEQRQEQPVHHLLLRPSTCGVTADNSSCGDVV
ncbi:hypothetical protein GE061_012099 [Apolygus lucorum]|uniref:Cathepsin propeptide inhibitor domain-containing protein n=1 Tax=Apolygus lucorum TaxID=248454 RepID=A0A8S9XU07_APOLU|nr:hypothetical protein GE061_012099 [Apolygus lucorum]